MVVLKKEDTFAAAKIINSGGLVAVPTETVYGLAASAMDKTAVTKIFVAKGRPQDNPLIVHIADKEQIFSLASHVPEKAQALIDEFWPGPLTVILPKSDNVIDKVTAGLDSVAVRLPANEITRQIIRLARLPVVAPSANRSGSPSPTKVEHVIEDMRGRVDAIIDGGDCQLCIESTVVSFLEKIPTILRKGPITSEGIEHIVGKIKVNEIFGTKKSLAHNALCPSTKYKHYSTRAKVVIVNSRGPEYIDFVNSKTGSGVYALCYEEDINFISISSLSYGKANDSDGQAKNLFSCLRKLDTMGAKLVYARPPLKEGIGIAVYDRLLHSAEFNVAEV